MRLGILLLLVGVAFAGCAAESEPEPVDDVDTTVEVTDDTGGIRGLVVDATITPIEGIAITALGGGQTLSAMTDKDGLFTFGNLDPGPYVVKAQHPLYTEAQTSTVVEAGVAKPPLVRIQVERLFDGDPFIEQLKFKGYFQCAYNLLVSSTCVNDYTRICSTSPCCPGGCFPELARLVDKREYVTQVNPEWQSINVELVWDASLAGTSESMGMTVSYFGRVGATHRWHSGSGESPYIARLDCAAVCGDDFPSQMPKEGLEDFFVFMSAGSANVAIGQNFEVFQTNSYYAPLPDDWSFVKGDPPPF